MMAYHGDGNDVEEVLGIAGEAIDNTRRGMGPQFLEFQTYRWREHCGPNFDHELEYRSTQEIKAGMNDCPLVGYAAKLNRRNEAFRHQAEAFETEIASEIIAAFEFALSSGKPSAENAGGKVYV